MAPAGAALDSPGVRGGIVAMVRSVGFEEVDETNTEELSSEDLELEKLSLSLWLYRPLDLGHIFGFLILYTVGRTPWTRDQHVARLLPT
jgi:hypothetical protein